MLHASNSLDTEAHLPPNHTHPTNTHTHTTHRDMQAPVPFINPTTHSSVSSGLQPSALGTLLLPSSLTKSLLLQPGGKRPSAYAAGHRFTSGCLVQW